MSKGRTHIPISKEDKMFKWKPLKEIITKIEGKQPSDREIMRRILNEDVRRLIVRDSKMFKRRV